MSQALVVRGNALNLPLEDESVDLVITSPPYFALRSYRDEGEHFGGQIGSEPTPKEFLEALWAATREMVRVLKPTGSIWVNLGDKYAGSGGHNNANVSRWGTLEHKQSQKTNQQASRDENVAQFNATRRNAPDRYNQANRFDDDFTVGDAGWLAGLIDADGTITVRRTQQPQMRAPTYEGIIAVEQSDEQGVRRAHQITQRGHIVAMPSRKGNRPSWRWTVSTQEARWVAERIWPWLQIKQRQAQAIVELGRHRQVHSARGRWNPIKPEWITYRQLICDAVRAWNAREPFDWEPPILPVIKLPDRPRFIPSKSLIGLPWRYAIGCIDDLGLILRAEVVWSKPNGLPESVTDRVRRSHEQWFHFTKEPQYFAAVDEVREVHADRRDLDGTKDRPDYEWSRDSSGQARQWEPKGPREYNPLGKLPGSVWQIPSEPLLVPEWARTKYNLPDHFAAFPQEWPRRIILGWSPSGVCVECGEGRRPVVDKRLTKVWHDKPAQVSRYVEATGQHLNNRKRDGEPMMETFGSSEATITGYACACTPREPETRPSVVLDPFGGTGTVAMVARALGRLGVSVDLSMDYSRLAKWRIFESGHASKTRARTNLERQGAML